MDRCSPVDAAEEGYLQASARPRILLSGDWIAKLPNRTPDKSKSSFATCSTGSSSRESFWSFLLGCVGMYVLEGICKIKIGVGIGIGIGVWWAIAVM